MDIATRIKQLRADRGINQEELAAGINVSRGNVGDWERGRTRPSAEALVSLSKYFNVSVNWLLTGEYFYDPLNYENPANSLSSTDFEILAKFHQLSEREQIKVEGIIEGILLSRDRNNKKLKKESLYRSQNGDEHAAANTGA